MSVRNSPLTVPSSELIRSGSGFFEWNVTEINSQLKMDSLVFVNTKIFLQLNLRLDYKMICLLMVIIHTLTEGSIWDKLPQIKFAYHELGHNILIMHIYIRGYKDYYTGDVI